MCAVLHVLLKNTFDHPKLNFTSSSLPSMTNCHGISIMSTWQLPPPPPPICALTVHAPQTSILREQGCTCTPRQALFSDLSTFIQAITRDYHHILLLGDFNTYSELPQIDQHQPFPLSSPHPMGPGVLVNQAFCLMWQHYNRMMFFKLDVSTLSIKHLLIGSLRNKPQ